ncbi:hypothetical protein GGR42_002332 [Saonia flava]|uniref:DUF547 domain-containing protein n=1 Tax=Saonia flava TaxID=523696 RepID=A0A846QY54_9FLAO|nr:DUF547 domain-containing protein [Saonia flava]NJB71870.1 hypothetical protein [Saonia flava]
MVKSIIFSTFLFFLGNLYSQEISYPKWDSLLQKHVSKNGDVDYKKFKNNMDLLNDYLDGMATNNPKKDWGKNEKLAYYINIYNAATVKLILDNYPLKSIKDIKKPWSKKWVWIGDKQWSLGDIEHKILRKMDEPRIHFAINCASYSCPKLLNEAYIPTKIEAQLQQATASFLNDSTKNTITSEKMQLSKIFKWYYKDFTKSGNLINYIESASGVQLPENISIEYLDYNWSLNEKK